jgi:hypothetical protein
MNGEGEKEVLCWHDDHAGYIYKFIQWGIVFDLLINL